MVEGKVGLIAQNSPFPEFRTRGFFLIINFILLNKTMDNSFSSTIDSYNQNQQQEYRMKEKDSIRFATIAYKHFDGYLEKRMGLTPAFLNEVHHWLSFRYHDRWILGQSNSGIAVVDENFVNIMNELDKDFSGNFSEEQILNTLTNRHDIIQRQIKKKLEKQEKLKWQIEQLQLKKEEIKMDKESLRKQLAQKQQKRLIKEEEKAILRKLLLEQELRQIQEQEEKEEKEEKDRKKKARMRKQYLKQELRQIQEQGKKEKSRKQSQQQQRPQEKKKSAFNRKDIANQSVRKIKGKPSVKQISQNLKAESKSHFENPNEKHSKPKKQKNG